MADEFSWFVFKKKREREVKSKGCTPAGSHDQVFQQGFKIVTCSPSTYKMTRRSHAKVLHLVINRDRIYCWSASVQVLLADLLTLILPSIWKCVLVPSLCSSPGVRFPLKHHSSQPPAGSLKGFAKVQEPFKQILADLWVSCTKHTREALGNLKQAS